MSNILVTGGCGFAGSHIVNKLNEHPGNVVIIIDNLGYAADLGRLTGSLSNFIFWDFSKPARYRELLDKLGPIDYVVHNGAESHVSNSIVNPRKFVESNVIGTLNILELSRMLQPRRFIYISTDEVFGEVHEAQGVNDKLNPGNPYSATKAGGEYLTRAYCRAYGLNTTILRSVNLFGEHQHVEKFIPMIIKKILNDETIYIHQKDGVVGSRRWAYVGLQAAAIRYLCDDHDDVQPIYHLTEGVELDNLKMAKLIADILGKKLKYLLRSSDRPSYDSRYELRIEGSVPWQDGGHSFMERITQTVEWYKHELRSS